MSRWCVKYSFPWYSSQHMTQSDLLAEETEEHEYLSCGIYTSPNGRELPHKVNINELA